MTDLSRRKVLALTGAVVALPACETTNIGQIADILGQTGAGFGLTQAEAAQGIRAALNNGVGNAVSTVGVVDGFLKNSLIRIALPQNFQNIAKTASRFGMGGLFTELETQLNRGAEIAAPVARDVFVEAVSGLSIADAINIVRGPDTAATDFLKNTTGTKLTSLFSPIMENALGQTGALRIADQLQSSLSALPIQTPLSSARSDLIAHGVSKGLDGMFYYIGEEEKAIRANPAKRTSEILRRVFGSV